MNNEKITLLIPTILSGGAGTRLWPLSRDKYPKQLLPLIGSETMLQETIRRMTGFVHPEVELSSTSVVVCNEEHRFIVAEQINAMAFGEATVILEPCGRNTAPALTIASIHASQNGQDPLMLIMPADHAIANPEAFRHAVGRGIGPALGRVIVTFGIEPDYPETGYGYIQANPQRPFADRVFPITRFVEKPDRETAETYLATGNYYWNSGIFLLRASTWLTALKQLHPEMLDTCICAFNRGSRDRDFLRLDRETFSACPADSIDYAVMEKLVSLSDMSISGMMVPLTAGWSDVGAWDAVLKIGRKDVHGNSSSGDVILEDTRHSLILSSSRLVSCVGIDGLIVIETPDAVLVANRDKVQDVKKIVSTLRNNARSESVTHRKVYRPWGWYNTLEQGEQFQVRRLHIKPDAILGMQLHRHRSEHWMVVQGTARVTRGDETFALDANQSAFIPAGEKHRIENPGEIAVEIIEIQSGTYLGDDDIMRLENCYGSV